MGALFLAASVVYVIFHVVGPGGTAPHIDPTTTDGPAQLARYHAYAHESYGDFLWQFVGHGSLGRGLYYGQDLTAYAFGIAPVTLSIVGGALLFALIVGVPLGLVWALRRRAGALLAAPFRQLSLGLSPIWLWVLLVYFLAFRVELLPGGGYCDFFSSSCNGPTDWAYHLILPSITIGLSLAAVYVGVVRRLCRSVLQAGDRDGDASRARRRAVIAFARLVLRHASWLIGATLFAEVLFGLPGLAYRLVGDLNGDPPVAEAFLMVAVILAVGLSLAVDLIVALFVPDWRVNELRAGRPQDVPHWALT